MLILSFCIEDDVSDCSSVNIGGRKSRGRANWMPIHNVWSWTEGVGRPLMVSVVIVLPSGVDNMKECIKVNVGACCRKLTVTMDWPKEVTETMTLHRWMGKNAVTYHPRLMEYEECLKKRRRQISENVTSMATINLPCRVLRSLEKNQRFKFSGSMTQVMYVDLQANKHLDYCDHDSNEVIELWFSLARDWITVLGI